MIMIEPLYHITEIEKMIGINRYSIYKKIRQNKFPSGVKCKSSAKSGPIESIS